MTSTSLNWLIKFWSHPTITIQKVWYNNLDDLKVPKNRKKETFSSSPLLLQMLPYPTGHQNFLRSPILVYKIIRISHIHFICIINWLWIAIFKISLCPQKIPFLLWHSRPAEFGMAFFSDLLTSLLVQYIRPTDIRFVPQAHKSKLQLLPGLLSGMFLRISMADSSDSVLNRPLLRQGCL